MVDVTSFVVGKSIGQHGCWKLCEFQRPLLSRLQRHGRVVGTVFVNGGRVLSDRLLNVRRTKHGQGSVRHSMCAPGWPGCGAMRETECSQRGDVHGGGWHQAPHAQETPAHVSFSELNTAWQQI